MKQRPLFYKYIFIIFFAILIQSTYANLIKTTEQYIQPEKLLLEEEIPVDESCKEFIISLIEKAVLKGEEHLLSQGLLHCYETITSDVTCSKLYLIDLIDAFDDLVKGLQDQLKAPRPSPTNAIVGGTSCNLAGVLALLQAIQSTINQCCQQQLSCCAELISDFQQTWTILANIGTVTAVVDLSPVFTALNACCTNINSEFQQTWSILGAGFNGTFSAINGITGLNFNGTYSAIAAGFDGTFSCTQCMLH